MLIPYQGSRASTASYPRCNCGRIGDLESLCSLTAIAQHAAAGFLTRYPDHELRGAGRRTPAKRVRRLAERGDAMCRDIFRVQAHALGLFFDRW